MIEHCFNLLKKTALSSKPSKAIGLFLMIFLAFSNFINAQCSITSSISASSLTCGTSPVSSCGGILYIGDGSTSMTLSMNADLDLSCLGPIQFIVRNNATLDFGAGSNKNLKLATGSSIEFQTGSTLDGGSSCSSSDLIYIGATKVASCNGNGGAQMSFPTIVTNGYSPITASASPSSICNSGSSTITATASPSSGATYKWYTVASGGSPVYTGNPYSTGTISATNTYYVDATYTSPAYTTIRRAVTVTVNRTPAGLSYTTTSPSYCYGTAIATNSASLSTAGTPAATYSVSPALPSGLSLDTSTGAITGIPTVAVSAANYTVTATNTCGSTTRSLSITVNRAPAGLSYTTSSPNYCYNTAITTNSASLTTTGSPAATYSVSPALPSGLFLNTSTGAITGNPSTTVASTNYTVTATNTCGTTTAVLAITVNRAPSGLSYTTTSPSYCYGTAIATNNASLSTAGTPAATYSVSPALPSGLSLDTSTGAITGIPTVAVAAANYTVTATNTCGSTTRSLSITVNRAPAGLSYTTTSPSYCYNTAIATNSASLTTAGTPAATYSVSPALPSGLSLNTSTGAITGNPSTTVASTNYTVTATNTCGTTTAVVTITVNRAPSGLSYTTTSPSYCQGTAIATNNASLSTAGTPAATYSVSPALPSGLSLDTSTGAITGIPTVAVSAANYTVTATNTCGSTTRSLSITVNRAPAGLSYTTTSPSYCYGTAIATNSASLTAAGIPAASYSVSPALPSGLSLNTSTGAITGTPWTTAATANYTVTATNTCGNTTAVLSIAVNQAPSGLSYTTTSPSYCQGTAIATNSASLSTAGTPAATYSVSPALPTGLSLNTSTGAITGMPTVAVAATNYTISATNSCSTATAVVTITVSPITVGGSATGSATAICLGSSTGTLTVSGHTGTILRWERQINSGGWNNMNNGGSTTFSETPYSAGIWEYRAVIQSGSCLVEYSGIKSIQVDQTPVGGGVYSGTTPICINSSTGNMTLGGGYVGNIIRWEKRLLPSATWTTIANTTAVYSESPSVAGTWEYRALVGSGSCTSVYSSAFSVTVNPELTITLTSTNANVCQTTTTTTLAYSATTGSPVHWQIDFDTTANGAGFSDQNNGLGGAPGTITINVPYSVATGTYNGNLTVITYTPSCISVVYPITVTVAGAALAPTVTTIQPNCTVSTGQVTVTSPAPATGITYTVVGTSPVVAGVTNATGVFTGLAAGNYNVTVNSVSCGVSPATTVTINSSDTKIWNGSWLPSGAPTSGQVVILNSNYNTATDGDLNACSLTINGSATLTIATGDFVIIQNHLTVNGTLDVLDSGSLVMVNDAGIVTNNGVTNVHRTTTPFNLYDYTYWSTPVVSTDIASTFPSWNTDHAYEYVPANFEDLDLDGLDDDENDWSFASTMVPANGYIIMAPEAGSNPAEVVFSGKVNNGVQKVTGVIEDGTYLIGNPYPSALDADAFLDYNSDVIDGTLYFWTHNTAIQEKDPLNPTFGTGALAYTSDDYASYNAVGGVGVGTAAISGGTVPSGKIASGQGFFATTNNPIIGTNEIVFNNSMRLSPLGATLDNTQFFKTKTSKKVVTPIEKHRIWLNLTNTEGAFKQTLLGYVTGATNNHESRFDGESFDGNQYIDFYSINENKKLVIQGRALPFDETDEVSLGYRTTIDGDFTIGIEQVDGVLTNQDVFLEDKLTNTLFDLKTGKYTFSTAIGTFDDRFVLKYKNTEKTLGTGDFGATTNQVQVAVKDQKIKINSFTETIQKVMIYDLLGKLVYQKENINHNELTISDFVSSHQVLIVKTILQNGTTVTDKIGIK